MARGAETRIYALTKEDIERASCLYLTGMKFREVAATKAWSETLLWRVIRLCRECDDGPSFPRRKTPIASITVDQEALNAAKKPKTKLLPIHRCPTPADWKRALSEKGLKPSTVPVRDPLAYRTKRKSADPTLALPRAS